MVIGVGGAFGLSALSKIHEAQTTCPSSPCTNAHAVTTNDDGGVHANVANVSIGVGLIALGIGTYLVLSGPSKPRAGGAAGGARGAFHRSPRRGSGVREDVVI